MTTIEAIRARHSVRRYLDKAIPQAAADRLRAEIDACNAESGLHIQLVTDEPKAFEGFMAHYGKFDGVRNYIALIGKKGPALEEELGYYGERIALLAQCLGLNTCWVALTFDKGESKKRCAIAADEKLVAVLALGYGATQGVPHKSKSAQEVSETQGEAPDWFRRGVEAALLAPTAVNQQKFKLSLDGRTVRARSLGGFYSRMDLGIVKYHFETAAGRENFTWG